MSNDTDTRERFLPPAIIAALLWMAVCLYLLLVVGKLFNLEFYFSKPQNMQSKASAIEQGFVQFQVRHGVFWTACFGAGGCLLAAFRRSQRIANVMIVLGIAALAALIWATLPGS